MITLISSLSIISASPRMNFSLQVLEIPRYRQNPTVIAENPKSSDAKNLQNSGIVRYRNPESPEILISWYREVLISEILRPWSGGILKFRNLEVPKSWNSEILKFRNLEIPKSRSSKILELSKSLRSWNLKTSTSLNSENAEMLKS